ncbi:MAG: livF [Pseudonocardiales bacterium]|nr:livF [Pseudonocardiales bacterium]
MSPILTCHNVSAGYHRQAVVRGLNLEVEPGEIVAILGSNGAGKTTSLLTIAGLLTPLGGEVRVGDKPVNYKRPFLAARSGVQLVPDDKCLFTSLSVAENISFGRRGRDGIREAVEYFPALEKRLRAPAGVLSGGEQQLLALARALVARPKVMLIDELSMGLAPVIVQQILAVVRRIANEKGTAVILVEQHVHMALQIADRATVLAHGDVVLERPAAELREQPHLLQESYLGRTA